MKFIAIAAIAIVAAQDEMAAEEVAACPEGECNVTDETGETACTAVVEG